MEPTVICPRCQKPDVTGPSCPGCGVIFAKLRPERLPPTRVGAPEVSYRLVLLVVLGAAVLVLTLLGLRGLRRPAPAALIEAVPGPAPELTPPPLPLPSPSPLAPLLEVATASIPSADQELATRLVDRLNRRVPLNDRDLAATEALYSRYPQERAPGDLLTAVLLALAEQQRMARHLGEAIAYARRAVLVRPDSLPVRKGLAQLVLETGDWASAEAAARDALRIDPADAEALAALGCALFRQDHNREAVEALQASLAVRQDVGVRCGEGFKYAQQMAMTLPPLSTARAILDSIQKSRSDESGMKEQRISHFDVRYDGEVHEEVGREVLRVLERHYATLARRMDYELQTTPVGVVLFSKERYHEGGGGATDPMDGRIRVPILDLTTTLPPDLEETLLHELTHVFVLDRSRGAVVARFPLHEGLAQYMSGTRIASTVTPAVLTGYGRREFTDANYWLSLAFVEHLASLRGQGGLNDLLKVTGETRSVDEAFRQVYGGDFGETWNTFAARLKRQQGQ